MSRPHFTFKTVPKRVKERGQRVATFYLDAQMPGWRTLPKKQQKALLTVGRGVYVQAWINAYAGVNE